MKILFWYILKVKVLNKDLLSFLEGFLGFVLFCIGKNNGYISFGFNKSILNYNVVFYLVLIIL